LDADFRAAARPPFARDLVDFLALPLRFADRALLAFFAVLDAARRGLLAAGAPADAADAVAAELPIPPDISPTSSSSSSSSIAAPTGLPTGSDASIKPSS
jgi:hypothetical protein